MHTWLVQFNTAVAPRLGRGARRIQRLRAFRRACLWDLRFVGLFVTGCEFAFNVFRLTGEAWRPHFGIILRLGGPLGDHFGTILRLGGSFGDHFGIIFRFGGALGDHFGIVLSPGGSLGVHFRIFERPR